MSAEKEIEKVKAQAEREQGYIALAKEKGAVHIEIDEVDGKDYVAYFKTPGRAFIGAAMGLFDTDPLKATEMLFDGSVIREISDVDHFRNNDGLMINLSPKLQALIPLKKSRSIRL